MDRFERLGYTKLQSLMLHDMSCAATTAKQWSRLSNYTEDVSAIDAHIEYKDHTEETYKWCMDQLRLLSRHGFRRLARIRGVNLDWMTFVGEVESIPELREQAEVLRKFERGEISYAEMRTHCG